jgi:hypothetical protein
MALTIFNAERRDVGAVTPFSLDIEAGGENWVSVTLEQAGAYGAYIPGTEYGGLLEKVTETTDSRFYKYEGHTWRGLLSQKVLEPPSGEDYYMTPAGDASDILGTLIGSRFSGLIAASSAAAGITVSAHQYSRYCTLLEGIEELCRANGLKLVLTAERGGDGLTICTATLAQAVNIGAVYGEDSRYKMRWTDDGTGINHLICLGSGELKDRHVLHLYADAAGTISTTQTITGLAERTAVYDYGNIENNADLEKEGRKRFRELLSARRLEVDEFPDALKIGDSITSRRGDVSYMAPIDRIIVKCKNGRYSTEYRIKEET